MSWPEQKVAGVCLHLTSLPGRLGIGTLGAEAHRFVDQLRLMGIGCWQFLPLGPTAYADSPYQALSSFAGNPLLIDLDVLVQQGLLDDSDLQPLNGLARGRVDFGALIPLKTALLHRAAARFRGRASARCQADYAAFRDRHEKLWLHDFALYRLLKTRHGEQAWPLWGTDFVARDAAALRRVARRHAEELEAVKLTQFFFARQWQALRTHAADAGVVLFGDIPIYVALDSADAWAGRELLMLDEHAQPRLVAGVPPDYFSADGQLWGNPVYDWDYHAATGYAWWIARCAHNMELMDLLRIDHFRGFEAYWGVPHGASTARDGAWLPGPGHAIFEALERALGALPIVAEDLGVITEPVVDLRQRHAIPGMVVLQFDVPLPDFRIENVPADSVCYTGTHDNDTTVGWFAGAPGDTRDAAEIDTAREAALRHTGGAPETIHLDMIRLAFSSAARIAMIPMQDYLGLGSEARMNTPGTESGNWRWRLLDEQLDSDLVGQVAALVAESGRSA